MNSIIIILPYFGNWANVFPFWLTSCKNNPTIDWLVFTNCEIPNGNIPNVKFVNMTFSEFADKVNDFFPFQISLKRPYKLLI
jgi:hypothetical protein